MFRRICITALIIAGVWLLFRWVQSTTDAEPSLTAIERHERVPIAGFELVGEVGSTGQFQRHTRAHVVTFVSSQNSRNNGPQPKFTELNYYKRLLWDDFRDNKQDKNNCHFRFRVIDPAVQATPADELLLHLQSDKDAKQLGFEWVNGSLVSRPFILVTDRRSPMIPGLTELLIDERQLRYTYCVLKTTIKSDRCP